MKYDIDRAREAVQFLVDSSYFAHHTKKLRNTVDKPRSLPFKDDAECLNELLIIGRQNRESMENLISVAEYKRDDRGEYQRQYMAQKRKRDRKVIELDEILTGHKFSLDERNHSLHKQYAVWNADKETYLSAQGQLDWASRNEHIKHFWDTKEAELDELIVMAREQMSKMVARKRVVVVKKEPTSVMGTKLKQALAERINTMTRKGRLGLDKGR